MSPAGRKPRYDVFISYRRGGGAAEARLIQTKLQDHGFHAFLDVTDLDKGYFDASLLKRIAESPNFIVILSSHALDRCVDKEDWLRREIGCALATNRNVIPVLMPDFVFPPELPEDISSLPRHQGVPYNHVFFDSVVDRIQKMMLPVAKPLWRRPALVMGALVAVLAVLVGGYWRARFHSSVISSGPTQQEAALQQEADLLRVGHRFDDALSKYKNIVDLHGTLAQSARQEIDSINALLGQENALMSDGKAAESQNDFNRAKTDYQKAIDLHGAKELEAIDSFNVITQKMAGASDADIALKNFANGVTAFSHGEYAMAKASFDQVLARTPPNWPRRSQALDYARKAGYRAQQQQQLAQAQNYLSGKDYDAAREEATKVINTQDADPGLIQQARELIARIPAATPLPPSVAQPPSAPEIAGLLRDADNLIKQGQFKNATDKAAAIEQLKGDAGTLRDAIQTAEDTRFRELNSRYLATDKSNASQLQDVLSAFQQFAENAVNHSVDARQHIDEITKQISAVSTASTVVGSSFANSPAQPFVAISPAASSAQVLAAPAEVQAVLNRYAQAVASGDLKAVKAVRDLNASDEKKMAESLKAMKGKGFALRNCSTPEVTEETAKVSCDTVLTGSRDTPPARANFSLRRINGQWVIVP